MAQLVARSTHRKQILSINQTITCIRISLFLLELSAKLLKIEIVFYGFFYLLLLFLKDSPSLYEVRVGAPLRPNISKDNVSITLVGGLLLGGPPGTEPFLVLFVFFITYIQMFIFSTVRHFRSSFRSWSVREFILSRVYIMSSSVHFTSMSFHEFYF